MPGITKIQKWVKNIVTFLIGFYCLTGESGKHVKHNTKQSIVCHKRETSNVLWQQKKEEINFSWEVKKSFVEEAGIELDFEERANFSMWYYGVAWS